MTRRASSSLWPLLAAVLLTALAASVGLAEIKVSGYTQARYNMFDDSMYKPDEFDLRRVRVKFKGAVNEQGTVATVQVDLSKLDETGSGVVGLKDAIVEHPLGKDWRTRLGYSSVLFGFEVPYSSSRRLPFERSRAAKKLFPGERDTGIYFIRESANHGEPEFVVAYSDGMADWEDDEQSAFVGRIQWPLPNKGAAGISYMDGSRTRGDEEYSQDVWGAHVRWNGPSGFSAQAEYYDGKLLGTNVDGWYGQLEYAFPVSQWTGYYRYDTYDDGDPGHDTYKRNTFGAAYQLDKNQRISVELESLDNESGVSATNYGFQWLFKY
jgi:phosphate-selective porin